MILLFGGTSETRMVLEALAPFQWPTLVSTATEEPLSFPTAPWIHHRAGRLNHDTLAELIDHLSITCLIDASHPFAEVLHQTAASVALIKRIPYFRYERPSFFHPSAILTQSHLEAAQLACAFGQPILLTTGSKNLAEYVTLARTHEIPLFARVLNHAESISSCLDAGLRADQLIFGRGPFSVADNRALIQRLKIGSMITKESGVAGGVDSKLEAALAENCRFIMVLRPTHNPSGFSSLPALIDSIQSYFHHHPCLPPL